MRRSPRRRLTECAIALSLALGLTFALGSPAVASPTATLNVEVGSLLHVEATPLPSVEVPGVANVEVPKVEVPKVEVAKAEAPNVEAPKVEVPKVAVPSTPVAKAPSLPTTSTPVSPPPSSSSSSSSPTGTNAQAADTTGSSTSAGSPTASGSNAATAPASTGAASSSHAGARAGRAPRATRSGGRKVVTGAAATTPITTSGAAVSTRSAAAHGKRPQSSSSSASNPLEAIGRHIPFPVPVPDWSKPIILVLLLLAIWFAVRSRVAALRARRLERLQATLLHDLDAMQAALVPEIPERLGELSVSVGYRPADGPAAGGDFYDLFVLGAGRVAVVLGDVVGHGHGALTQAALTRYTLRAYIQAGLEPRAALVLAGSVLSKPGEQRFATVVIAIHDSRSGRLTYASAGHPPPLAVGFDAPEPLTVCCSAPICCELPTGRRQTTISIPTGGEVCFFSDGLLEARTADGLLGRGRLGELVEQLERPHRAPALLDHVCADVQATPDDMVACIIAPTGAAPAPGPSVEELEVDQVTLAGPHVPLFLQACGVPGGRVAALLAQAGKLADDDGAAVFRIERADADADEASAAVLPALSLPTWADGIEAPTPAAPPVLALPQGR